MESTTTGGMMVAGRQIRVWLVLFMLVCISEFWPVKVCKGQLHSIIWSEPVNLSNSSGTSIHPAIVTDTYGNVHVFWSEALSEQEVTSDGWPRTVNAIMYRRWDGHTWTEPVDILAVSGDTLADFVAATVDGDNRLHIVWTGLEKFYYSTALADMADSARAWSAPQIVAFDSARTAYESDIAADSDGNVHIVYATRNPAGVYHVMILSESGNWTVPTIISGYLRYHEAAFMHMRLAIDAADRLHATWSTANINGYGQAVYYARSETPEQVWETPILLADATIENGFTGFPSLLTRGEDGLLLIHVDQGNKGRIERSSADAGKTWGDPRFVLSSMEGVNGFLIPLRDGGGGLHLVINMRPSADQRVGIYYALRAGLDWAPIVPVAVDELYASAAHYTDAVMRSGNEIHVVWTQLRSGEIWYVRGTIVGLERIPVQATPSTSISLQAVDVLTSTTIQPIRTSEDMPSTLPDAWRAPSEQTTTQWTPIVAAVIPVLLLVVGAVMWRIPKK